MTGRPPAWPVDWVDVDVVMSLWELTFDVGGKHHTKKVRDEATVEWVVDCLRRASARGDPTWAIGAMALHHVVREHPFMDCNHRTGWLLCRTLMYEGGYRLALPSVEVVRFVRSIDSLALDEPAVVEWVRRAFLRLA